MIERLFFTEKEIAYCFDVSVKKLQKDRQMKRGLPYFKYGRNIRYDFSDVREYISSHKVL
jgi:hypothetical protein